MKLWLKILLGVIGGFGGGFAAGFLTHKKITEVQFEEVSEEELDSLLAQIPEGSQKAENDASKIDSKASERAGKAVEQYGTDPDKLRNALQGKTPYMAADEDVKKEYSKMWNTVKSYSNEENANELPVTDDDLDLERSIDQELLSQMTDDIDEPPTQTKPYRITLGEFYEERREYDKVTIDWFDEDNVVLDEREDIIADPESYVGCSMKELFADPPPDGDPDAVFIRNDKYGTDYEVIRHHASYRRTVSGDDE